MIPIHLRRLHRGGPPEQDCGIDRRTERERIRDRRADAASEVRTGAARGLWLIAETTRGVYLEYWRDGAAVVSLEPRPALSIEQLELVLAEFRAIDLIPRAVDVDSSRGAAGFSRETQD